MINTVSRMTPIAMSLAILGLCGGAQAESFKDKSGRGMYQPASFEEVKLPDGTMLRKEAFNGYWVTDMPSPYDYVKNQCHGTNHIAADGKSGRVHGYCELTSTKGDRAAFWYAGDYKGGSWGWIDGSGAYAEIKGGGTYKPVAAIPGGGLITQWTGSWEATPQATAKKD